MQDFIYDVLLTSAGQEILKKSSSYLPLEMMYSIVGSRIKVILLLSKEVLQRKGKLESLCCNLDMPIVLLVFRRAIVHPNSWNS